MSFNNLGAIVATATMASPNAFRVTRSGCAGRSRWSPPRAGTNESILSKPCITF